jgi:hypothetical protein
MDGAFTMPFPGVPINASPAISKLMIQHRVTLP